MFSIFKNYILDHLRYFYYVVSNDRFKESVHRYKAADGKKSKAVIKNELAELKRYWGCIPMQYYTHDFYRADCELTLEDMKKYIPGYFFYFVLYPKFDNLEGVKYILENKIACYYLFKGMDLPGTTVIGMKKDGAFIGSDGTQLNSAEFLERIQSTSVDKVFVKPVSGCGGKGIYILKKDSDRWLFRDKELEAADLEGLSGDYVIEPKILQSEYLNRIYPHSVNTLRAVTCRSFDGSVRLIAVTLRMGTNGREVDNGTQGGLLIGIDLDTGKPLKNYAGYEYGCEKFYSHPDTDFNFSDLAIENWSFVRQEIIGFARKMALYNLVGWDIALTNEGPMVIEANTKFGIDHSQSGVGGMKDQFFIDDPKLWDKEHSA